jgi:hypothetical protein
MQAAHSSSVQAQDMQEHGTIFSALEHSAELDANLYSRGGLLFRFISLPGSPRLSGGL